MDFLKQKNVPLTERKLSLKLIKILYLHLMMPENRNIMKRYTEEFAFLKYIAEDF